MDSRLVRLRIELFTTAQTLKGEDAIEFWRLIDDLIKVKASLLIEEEKREVEQADQADDDLRACAEALEETRDCFDHANNCCSDWCGECQRGKSSQGLRIAALARPGVSAVMQKRR